ncbi:BnaC05g13910D [Brassica napus]|uniref:BnaC05g13910D protein n=1 Tax=Brassica napus TaxID=3708 RepID=A0A078FXR4_BRANA|nr:BnaC05g13910D [Brassica napus]
MMIPNQSFFFIFFLSVIFNTLASPTHQRDALLEFKNEFPFNASDPRAPSEAPLSSWNTSSDHCSWKGVTCNAHSSEVISLVLEYTYLNGSLKSNTSLLKLHHLHHLTLYSCDLIGEIPSSLGNLSHLRHLNISDNNFLTGEVPPSIGNLNQLKIISFYSNKLNGTIPSSFANFNKLSYLLLTGNQFSSGDLPLILSNLTSLSYFDISDNHFKSKLPSNMSGLHNLEVFRVNSNSLIGTFPTSLFTIPSLRVVSLSENQLEGPLEFGNTSSASELQYLDLASNNLYGPIPEDISRFLKLEFIDLSNNSFTGLIPGSMPELVSLKILDLSYNKLEGQVPSFLWRISQLTLSHNFFSSFEELPQAVVSGRPVQFDLGSNALHGSLPRWICKRASLIFLDLSNNHLSGSIPSCLMNCTASLGVIILRNNNLSGFLPDIFTNATKLRSLDVSRNQLSGKLPKSLINCTSMEYLNLKGNKFKDTFPSWLSSLGSLSVLFLGSNAFYGPVSSHLGFPSLRVIDLSNNSFSGTLPQDYFVNWREMASVGEKESVLTSDGIDIMSHMGELSMYEDSMDMMYKGVDTEFPKILYMFKAIDFSGNKFTGRIPKSIGMLKELLHVNFSRNAFTGSIPSSLANITNLEALDLSHNKLSGNIPRDLANLSFVSYLDFSHNLLQGPVPRSTQFQRQHCSSFEDNLELYGLEEICGPIHVPHPTSGDSHQSEESEETLSWKAAAIAFGPGIFCGLVIGYIFFTSHKQTHMVHGKDRLNHLGGIITVRYILSPSTVVFVLLVLLYIVGVFVVML